MTCQQARRSVKTQLLAAGLACVIFGAPSAQAQEDKDAEIKRLQDELTIQTTKNQIAEAKYGEALKGKSGDVANADKLSGMAYQHLPWATQQVGMALGDALDTSCDNGTVVLSGAAISDKLASAISFSEEIARLNQDIIDAMPKKGGLSGPAILSAASAAVALTGLFKSDYTVHQAEMAVDMDWLLASILLKHPEYSSERFPNRALVDYYISNVAALKNRADALPESKTKGDIVKRVSALTSALYTPGSDGILPIVTTALLSPVAAKKANCLAVVTAAKAAPILLTKETIWGKGGRAFVYLPVQASIIQLDGDGVPRKMACRIATVSAPVKLSRLTRMSDKTSIPWSGHDARYAEATSCSVGGRPFEETSPASKASEQKGKS